MPRVRAKKKKNGVYYYLVESRRSGPNKSPREHILEYIGTIDKLMEFAAKQYNLATSPQSPPALPKRVTFKSYEHGAEIAMLYVAQLLGIEDIFDQCFTKRKLKGMSRSRIILLTMIHRAIDPDSKRAFSQWAKGTSLPYYLRFDPDDLSSQTIWEAMDGITQKQMDMAQKMLIKRILKLYPTDLTTLHLDYTNYFTFIDSLNNRCVICKRGHNKQKRDDLRQFSLALITSAKLQVPIVWELYDGNKNDKTEFSDFTSFAAGKLKEYGIKDIKEVILTFDGGSNSEANFASLPFSFICAHSMAGHPELYDIDLDEYEEISLNNGHLRVAYELPNFTFSGVEGKGVLTFSRALFDGQMSELTKDIAGFQAACSEIADSIGHPRGKYIQMMKKAKEKNEAETMRIEKYNETIRREYEAKAAEGVKIRGKRKQPKELPVWDEANVMRDLILADVLKGRKQLQSFVQIGVEVSADDGTPTISCAIDEEKKSAFVRKFFGKKLICTNCCSLPLDRILSVYSEQECIENLFKTSKNPDHFSVRPQFHWTDQKIRVHVMICLFAISAAEVLRRIVGDHGMEYTKEALLDELKTIRDGWIIHDMKKADRVLEELNEKQQKLMDIVTAIGNKKAV